MDDLFSGKSQDVWGESVAAYLPKKIERLDRPFLRTPIHGARHVRVRSNKSIIESILSPSSSYGNAFVPRPTHTESVCSFSVSSSSSPLLLVVILDDRDLTWIR